MQLWKTLNEVQPTYKRFEWKQHKQKMNRYKKQISTQRNIASSGLSSNLRAIQFYTDNPGMVQ